MTENKNTNNKNDNRELKTWRKVVYIIGNIFLVVGVILFMSSFFTSFGFFQGRFEFIERLGFVGSFMFLPVFGFALIFVGSLLKALGRGGLAGAGLILDPERERRDAEPFSRSKGGKFADSYDEFRSESKIHEDLERVRVSQKEKIMVRCPKCKTLNDEDASFCKSCGEKLI